MSEERDKENIKEKERDKRKREKEGDNYLAILFLASSRFIELPSTEPTVRALCLGPAKFKFRGIY